ncbi:MAG: PD40 domain-containing protein [Anaerolineales bacterium]|nr:PD40 domain-containing protein [Anaerolineales bacterium]
MSDDGRYISFSSGAANLVSGDTNGQGDVLLHDTQTGVTTRISTDSNGLQANNYSGSPSISSDGRYIAFASQATNLVPGDVNGKSDVFIHDMKTSTTTLVSVGSSGTQWTMGSTSPSISADGRYVAFRSGDDNLVSGDTNGCNDIFVRDLYMGITTRVSVDSNGTQAGCNSVNPSISANGRFVSFESTASNLVAGDTNAKMDIFVHDMQTGITTRVSIDSNGIQANDVSQNPSISADGRYITYESGATNLVSGDTNATYDVFVHDQQTGNTLRASTDSNGVPGNGFSGNSFVSANGSYVIFESRATNLVPNDTNGRVDIFVYDVQSGSTSRVSVNSNGEQAVQYPCSMSCYSFSLSSSADGQYIAFTSYFEDLVTGDTNSLPDVFVHRQQVHEPITYYVKWDAMGANNGSSWIDAYTSLQSALSAAQSGDEIWVAAGTYRPTNGVDRTISFTLKNSIAIYGGFAGTETLRSQRNVQTNVTTLSGDIGIAGDTSDNSYHIVVGNNTDNTAVLDGFTITGGNANGISPYDNGGGMYSNLGSPTLTNIIFNINSAVYGAGMSNNANSNPVLANVTFNNNTAVSAGGGIYNFGSSPTLTDVIFSNNSTVSNGEGGGLFNKSSSPSLQDVAFINNSATFGGGMINGENSNPNLTGVTFTGNNAEYGAGILNLYCDPVLTNVTFEGNSSTIFGGGLMSQGGSPRLTNVTFFGNSATSGGGIYNIGSKPILTNVILWGDTATSSQEIYNNNTSIPLISYSIVQGGCPARSTCTNIITTDPMLGTLGNYGGFTQTIPLLAGSSAIDAGNDANCPTTDQRGVTRPQGNHCDIGAYEVNTFTPIAPVGTKTSWNNTFSWIGHSDATQYFIQVQKADGTTLLTKWYTASQAGCDTDTGCTITPSELATLGTGNYKWRIRDYGSSGYSPYSPYLNFDLSVTCYTLNTNTSGSGTIQAPAYTCGSGYTAGSTIQISALPNTGFAFGGWSGDASGTSTPVNITMDANKSVTASFLGETLIAPSGPLTSWNNTFSWTGHTAATNYFVEVRKADNTVVLTKWYTAAQASCDTDTSCTITPSELANFGVGSYKWRVRDYGTYGYGPYSPYMTFDLTLTCYTLTTNVIGSGSVLVPAQTCSGGYVTGSVIQVTGVPSAGFALGSWSGDASGTSNPVSITMNANKSITATFRGETLIAPSGLLTSWSNAFSWTGHTAATNYFVEVRKADNTVVLAKWYTVAQASCDTDTSCFISPTQLASLANGSYKWSVRDYGSTYGYGSYSPYLTFELNQP